MRWLYLSSICVLICHVLLGHLHTVKTNLSNLHKYFSLAVLFKDGFIPRDEILFGYELQTGWEEAKVPGRSSRPGLMCHTLITSASPQPRDPERPPCPRHQASFVLAGRGTSPKHPSPLCTGGDYAWLRGFGAGLFVRPRANSGVPGNAHLRESKPRAAGPNPRIPASVLRTSQRRFPSTLTNNK